MQSHLGHATMRWLEARCGHGYPFAALGCHGLEGLVVAHAKAANQIALRVIRFVHFRRSRFEGDFTLTVESEIVVQGSFPPRHGVSPRCAWLVDETRVRVTFAVFVDSREKETSFGAHSAGPFSSFVQLGFHRIKVRVPTISRYGADDKSSSHDRRQPGHMACSQKGLSSFPRSAALEVWHANCSKQRC
jgi:hypothetical protein